MAKQLEDLTLRIPRGIQATLAEHSKRFDSIDRRFEGLEDRLEEINEGMIAALGLATQTHARITPSRKKSTS